MPATPDPSLEQLFVRYREHGDLPALAAVFDAYAGHLLLVAGHVVRDGALAEDLVQTTFVEAIRCAARYDAERPLLPWLVRILTHHATKLGRRRLRPDDPRPARDASTETPVDRLLDAELVAAVEDTLATLPLAYRQVLTLRLVHDLSPTAIAHALGCPPETVKTRLRRGMELLRRQLPKGISAALLVTLASGRGIAAVRASVMEHAAGTTAAFVGVSLPLGVLIMNHVWVRWSLAALVLVLLWFGVDAAMQPAEPVQHVTSSIAPAQAELVTPAADAAAPRVASASTPVLGEAQVEFVGRCVDARTGEAMVGVLAKVAPAQVLMDGMPSPVELASVPTGVDGTFRLVCTPEPGTSLTMSVHRPGWVRRRGGFGPFPGVQRIDVGTLTMHPGVAMTTRVVDLTGRPVAGVVFRLDRAGELLRLDEALQQFSGIARSNANGEVQWGSAFLPGRYQVAWFEDSIPPQRWTQQEVVVPDDVTSCDCEIVWPVEDDRDSIRGTVVDERGQPVVALALFAEGGGTRGFGLTRDDGSFVIPRIGPYEAANRGPVEVQPNDGSYEWTTPATTTWGRQDLRLVVRDVRQLTVRAFAPGGTAPLRGCTIACALDVPGETPWVIEPRVTQLPDGSMRLAVTPQPHLLQVFPADAALAPSALLRWDPATTDELVVDLQPAPLVEIRLLTAAGEPVAGSVVHTLQTIEGLDGATLPGQDVPMPSDYMVSLAPRLRWRCFGVDDAPVDHGTTDVEGRVRLRVPANAPAIVAAFGPGHVPRAMTMGTGAGDVVVQVERGAAVRFEFSPPELVPQFLPTARDLQVGANQEPGVGGPMRQRTMVWATRVSDEQPSDHLQASVERHVTAASVRCDGLPAGRYELSFYARIGPALLGLTAMEVLDTVTLRDGEERVVPVDLRRWATGRVRGQVLVNGEPWALHEGALARGPMTSAEFVTDDDGRFEAEMIVGKCELHLRSMFDHSTHWCVPEPIEVIAGETIDVTVDVRHVVSTVAVVTAAGEPVVGLRVRMECAADLDDRREWTTDASGQVTIAPSPVTPFRLVAMPTGEDAADVPLTPLHVPPTGTTASFRVHLPND